MSDDLKNQAALAALDEVGDGMVLGIGTGSTAEAFVRALGRKVEDGMLVSGVPTSERTAELCRELKIPLTTLDDFPVLDLTVDGADELDRELNLIKGGGGALLREKIVAAASRRMVVIADGSKLVERLGAFALPIEANPFGIEPTRLAVDEVCRRHGMKGELTLRSLSEEGELGAPYMTDGGHHILDAAFGQIENAAALSTDLLAVPGVVQHGLFLGLADLALVADASGVQRIEREKA